MSDVNNSSMLLGKEELSAFCESESLSVEGLHEIIRRYGWTPGNTQHHINDYKFFHAACHNERVTEGIIQCLLECFPDAADAVGDDGEVPLHFACMNKSLTSGKIITLLIDTAPDSVRSEDNDGWMPLHTLCSRDNEMDEAAAIQILKFLLEKCPEAVRHADNRGNLPIHFAAETKSPEFCRLLIEAYPGSEKITDDCGLLPLHIACEDNTIAAVVYFYQQYPGAIDHATTEGLYPIHCAISSTKGRGEPSAAVDVVRFLLDRDSNEKLEKYKGRRSLVRYACLRKYNDSTVDAGIKIIETIFNAHPDSVRSTTDEGHMPLHALCRSDRKDGAAVIQILTLLIEKYPEAVRHADSHGNLPIHFAAETKSPAFCQVLIEAYPGSERIPDTEGALPLHLACAENTVETVGYFYRLFSEAIDATTDGFYPIHCAIRSVRHKDNPAAAVDIVRFLLNCDPNVKLQKYEGMPLLRYACLRRYNDSNVETGIEITKTLLNAHPDSLHSKDDIGWMPLHALCRSARKDGAATIKFLELLIEKCPEAVRHADINGYLPIHLAAETKSPGFCRLLIEAYPGSVKIHGAKDALPFHFACGYNTVDTVEYLYQQYPGAIDHAAEGFYPIHCAISEGATRRDKPAAAVDIVRFLLRCDPNEKLKQFHGQSLLWYACGRQYNDLNVPAGIQIIKTLLNAHPDSARSVNDSGWMPLHYLCSSASNMHEAAAIQILELLIEKCPEAVRHADINGDLPIHLASWGKSPGFCQVLIEAYPGSEQIPSADGALPLHLACQNNTVAAVEYLYRRHPDAINHATAVGFYPIHYAIDMDDRDNPAAAVDIVRFLLDCDPNQKLKERHGESLLHYAFEMEYNDSNIAVGIQMIETLYDAHPEAIEDNIMSADIQSFHQQFQAFINGEIVHARQAKDHRQITTPDVNGQLPLHRALQNNVRLGSIKLLVKGNPSAIRTSDNNFAMPLHIACEHHDSTKVNEYLLNLDRRTLRAVDIDNNTALHYACRGLNHDIIALLLEKYDATSVSKRNTHGKLPIDLLWESGEVSDGESVECMGSVFQLLRTNPEMLAISSNLTEDATRNGKKRKRNEEV